MKPRRLQIKNSSWIFELSQVNCKKRKTLLLTLILLKSGKSSTATLVEHKKSVAEVKDDFDCRSI